MTKLKRAIAIALILIGLFACKVPQSQPKSAHGLRLISLAPGVTEILFGIGAFDMLVADSKYCDYPEAAKTLPHVGGFYDANLEAIASMRPDLIIIIEDQVVFFKDKLEKLGYRVLVVNSRTVNDVIDSIRIIGHETEHQTQADKLADDVENRINERIKQTISLPRPRVLCVVDRVPGTLKDIYTAAPESFIDGLVSASGGRNISPPDKRGYSKIQQEAVVDTDPEIIIDMVHANGLNDLQKAQEPWQALPQISAVRQHRIITVNETFTRHPSQLMLETLDAFSKIIHPEIFGEYDK